MVRRAGLPQAAACWRRPPGHVRVVATTFEWAEDIDVERAKRAKEDAEQRIQNAKDPHELQLAKARLSRAQVRLNVAKR